MLSGKRNQISKDHMTDAQALQSKTLSADGIARPSKRQRVEELETAADLSWKKDVDPANLESPIEEEYYATAEEEGPLESDLEPGEAKDPQRNDRNPDSLKSTSPKKKLKALSSKRLDASQKAAKKTGVIYISRVPPFMKPYTVRNLLSPYGEIGRIFLTPEDPTVHKNRVKSGGNKKKSFTDGWVEFTDKKDAKVVAETLNAQIIGGKKGGWYHDDVWNIKYLKGFKWNHLTEQIANENAERAARMRAEIAQTTRENKIFLENVERAKIIETRRNRIKKKLDTRDESEMGSLISGTSIEGKRGFRSQFIQNEVKLKTSKDEPVQQVDEVKRVLSKIF